MKKHYFLMLVSLILAFCILPSNVFARPASSDLHTLSQPDGYSFKAIQWGDEYYRGWETLDGYSIIFNEQLKAWTYAKHDVQGYLVCSDSIVGKTPPLGLSKHLRPIKDARESIHNKRKRVLERALPSPRSIGTNNILIILVNFSDTQATYTRDDFENLLFKKGNFSLKDYYEEVSYSKFSVSSGPSGIQDWFTVSMPSASYGTPPEGAGPNDSDHEENIEAMVKEALVNMDSKGFDFAPYDNNGDGYVDTTAIIYQGFEESSSGDKSHIWPMQTEFSTEYETKTASPKGGKIKVKKFIRQGELRWKEGAQSYPISGIGTFAHEYGHALTLPDLYDTDYTSQGVGSWSLMAGGADLEVQGQPSRPCHLDAWSKYFLGWVTPIQVTETKINETIPPVESLEQNPGGTVYQILAGDPKSGEYFLLENRQKISFDEGLPGSGLLVWHIDGNVTSKFEENKVDDSECIPQGENDCSQNHYGVALIQADGLWDLEKKETNSGDDGDAFPGTQNKTELTESSNPNSNLWNKTPSNVRITNISVSGNNIIATLSAGIDHKISLNDVIMILRVCAGFKDFSTQQPQKIELQHAIEMMQRMAVWN